MYILIYPNEDNPIVVLNSPQEVLDRPDDYCIKKFEDYTYLAENPDPTYWPEGTAVLAKIEVLVPKPVTTKWGLS